MRFYLPAPAVGSSSSRILLRPPPRIPRSHCLGQQYLHTTPNTLDHDDDAIADTRQKAAQARIPSYTGWWTLILENSLPSPPISTTSSKNGNSDQQPRLFQGNPVSNDSQLPPSTTTTTSTIPPQITMTTTGTKKLDNYNTLPSAPIPVEKAGETVPGTTILPSASDSSSSLFSLDSGSSMLNTPNSYLYLGYKIPIKPNPPGAEDCCMSGCAHCIYDIYEEDRQDYKQALAKVLQQIQDAGLPMPPELSKTGSSASSTSVLDDIKDPESGMDPGMKAFLELERKLKGG